MNLHKFRQVKPSITTPEVKNPDYINHLTSLSKKRSHTALFASLGTVAACVLLLIAVIIWSAIGKNVRDGDDTADIPPATDVQEVTVVEGTEAEYTVDEAARDRFAIDIGIKHNIYQIPYFDKDNPPSVVDMANRMATIRECSGSVMGDKINEYSKKWFGVEIADNDYQYGCFSDMGDYMSPELTKMTSVQLSDGSTQYTATYNLSSKSQATLVYVGEMYAPTRFISHKRHDLDFDGHLKDRLHDTIRHELESADFVEGHTFYIEDFWARDNGVISFSLGLFATFNDDRPHAFFGDTPKLSPTRKYSFYKRGMTAVITNDVILIESENIGFGSTLYSDDDISDAMTVAYNYFKKNFKNCTLKSMYYGGDERISQYTGHAERNNADEVIVIMSNFKTSSPAPSGMEEFNDYTNFMWILVRNKGGKWRHVDHGY